MSNERKLIEFLNKKYNDIPLALTNENRMFIETGVAFGIEFMSENIVNAVNIDLNILGQYESDNS